MKWPLPAFSFCLVYLWALPALAASFSFAAFGDTQDNSPAGLQRLERLIADINSRDPAFSVHIGEFKGGSQPCPDAYYERVRATLNRFTHPVVFTPGDNDWTDCRFAKENAFDPIERLEWLRRVLFAEPTQPFRQGTLPLTSQGQPTPENRTWTYGGVRFATFHNVGTNNNVYANEAAFTEFTVRNRANLTWLSGVFDTAASENASALVLFTHANIQFDAVPWAPTGFDPFRQLLLQQVTAFGKPVLLVHGDTHQHKIDKPLKDKNGTVGNFTRLEVFGTPDLGVVYVDVDPKREGVFRFEPVLATP